MSDVRLSRSKGSTVFLIPLCVTSTNYTFEVIDKLQVCAGVDSEGCVTSLQEQISPSIYIKVFLLSYHHITVLILPSACRGSLPFPSGWQPQVRLLCWPEPPVPVCTIKQLCAEMMFYYISLCMYIRTYRII
jgi:hypothetical protein